MFWGNCKKGIHRFEPRYDLVWPEGTKIKAATISSYAFDELKNKIYVYDICVRCGKTIKREKTL